VFGAKERVDRLALAFLFIFFALCFDYIAPLENPGQTHKVFVFAVL
jgi:hypothetical protein